MPPSRPLVAVFAAALIAPALMGTVSSTASGTPAVTSAVSSGDLSTATAFRVRQSAKLFMHPQIADPGSKARSAGKAKSAMSAQFKPKKKGRVVQLQKKKGTSWVTVKKAKQNGAGRVEFVAPFKVKRKVQTYRVRAVKFDGLAVKASKGVSANKWGSADLNEPFSTGMGNFAHRQTDYTGMRECAISNPKNLNVMNGTLRLSVTLNADGRQVGTDPVLGTPIYEKECKTEKHGTHDYRYTGHVSTQGTRAYKYGYAAARMKMQKEAGQHAAFWMMPTKVTVDNPGAEIDVIEWMGDRSDGTAELTSFVQRTYTDPPVKDKTCGAIKKPSRFGSDWYTKYHVFSVEWTKAKYIFRIDGKETCRTTALRSHTPEYLLLSLQANNYELKYSKKNFPQHAYVDWVRFWDLQR